MYSSHSILCTIRLPYQAMACIFFTQFFTAVYNQEQLILQTIFVLQENSSIKRLKPMVYNQERFKNTYETSRQKI